MKPKAEPPQNFRQSLATAHHPNSRSQNQHHQHHRHQQQRLHQRHQPQHQQYQQQRRVRLFINYEIKVTVQRHHQTNNTTITTNSNSKNNNNNYDDNNITNNTTYKGRLGEVSSKQNSVDLTEQTPTVVTDNNTGSRPDDQVWAEISNRSSLCFGGEEYSLVELDFEDPVQKEGYEIISCSGPRTVSETKRMTHTPDANTIIPSNCTGRLGTSSDRFLSQRNDLQQLVHNQNNFKLGRGQSRVDFVTNKDQTHLETQSSISSQPTTHFTNANTNSFPNMLDMDKMFQKHCLQNYMYADDKTSDTFSRHLHQTSQEVNSPAQAELWTQHIKHKTTTNHHKSHKLHYHHHDQQYPTAASPGLHASKPVEPGSHARNTLQETDFPYNMPNAFLENNVADSIVSDSNSRDANISTGTSFLHSIQAVPIDGDSSRMDELSSFIYAPHSGFDYLTNSSFQSPENSPSNHLGKDSPSSINSDPDKKHRDCEFDNDIKPTVVKIDQDQFFRETKFDIWERERMLNFFKVVKTDVDSDANYEYDNTVCSQIDDGHFEDCSKQFVPNFLYPPIDCDQVCECEKSISNCLTDVIEYR